MQNKTIEQLEKEELEIAKELTYIGETTFGKRSLNPVYKFGSLYFVYIPKEDYLYVIDYIGTYLRYGIEDFANSQRREMIKNKVLEKIKEKDDVWEVIQDDILNQ